MTDLRLDDTIAAIASGATADAAIGLLRLSGPAAVAIAESLVPQRTGDVTRRWRSRRLYHERVVDPLTGAPIDDVLLSVMRAPRSYTGQDVVELSGHGGIAVRELLRVAVAAGARPAERGEFTLRAFLSGKLDLAQAEAVADAVAARTPAALSLAVAQLGGTLSERVGGTRRQLLTLYAQLEASHDFEDDVTAAEHERVAGELEAARSALDGLLETAQWGLLARDGVRVALVGRPNAGKSSLLNALLGADRAIVSPFPGTTRDVIEERVDLLGVSAVLADTAGIGESTDAVERLGIERTRRAMAAADLTVLVIDGSAPLSAEDRDVAAQVAGPAVIALTKSDLPVVVGAAEAGQLLPSGTPVATVSAVTGGGLDILRTHLARAGGWLRECAARDDTSAVVTSTRHRDALFRARQSVDEAARALSDGLALDAVCTDVRAALTALGEITGDGVTEDLLSEIFARFCIGK